MQPFWTAELCKQGTGEGNEKLPLPAKEEKGIGWEVHSAAWGIQKP